MTGLLLALVLTAPKPFTCTVDGKEWKALADTAVVTTNAIMGQRLGLGLAADAEGGLPRLEVTIAWKKLDGQMEATLSVTKPKLGADVQAFWTQASGAKPLPLDQGTVKVALAETTASFTLDLAFRDGKAVKCVVAALPLQRPSAK